MYLRFFVRKIAGIPADCVYEGPQKQKQEPCVRYKGASVAMPFACTKNFEEMTAIVVIVSVMRDYPYGSSLDFVPSYFLFFFIEFFSAGIPSFWLL